MINRRQFVNGCALGLAGSLIPVSMQAKTKISPAYHRGKGYDYQKPHFPNGSRLLFQGDSITDMNWGRNQSDRNHYLGHSYVFLLAARLGTDMPESGLEFFNRGKSGNKVSDLKKRWQTDALDMKPDLLSILVGTNDVGVGFRHPSRKVTPKMFERDYRHILQASRKANPALRLVLLDPFVLPTGPLQNPTAYQARRRETDQLRQVVSRLAQDFKAAHLPTQDIFDQASETADPKNWIWDGVHPLPPGHELIARHWLDLVSSKWPMPS